MKPQIAIAIYQLKDANKKQELLNLLQKHSKTLRGLDLLSDRPSTILEAETNFFLEIIEWKSEAQAQAAHTQPAVLGVWGELEKIAGFKSLSNLPAETLNRPFPKFKAVVPEGTHERLGFYSDNMIGAKNFKTTVNFYKSCFGLQEISATDDFSMLIDPVSQQKLCITNGPSVSKMSPGIASQNLETTLADFEKAGGKVSKKWEYPHMIGANCLDPENNEVLIWHTR